MNVHIPTSILSISGQCVKQVQWNESSGEVLISCRRDNRFAVIDPATGKQGTINRLVSRQIKDIPLCSLKCFIEIELAQVFTQEGYRRIEASDLVDNGVTYSKRFCRLISGLCRHMSISTVSRHFNIRWETVKNIDKAYLHSSLPALEPSKLTGLTYLGVDEVARAKGHDYFTVVYDLDNGQLIWVHEGRTAAVFALFLQELSDDTKKNILAVAMDMGPAYQKAVREHLPEADIVFDRFHVMQMYSKVIDNQRRAEFRTASKSDKNLIKGSRYLLLKGADKLKPKQQCQLDILLKENRNIQAIYILKEQLQLLWSCNTFEQMKGDLIAWCEMAEQTNMTYIKRFAKSLRRHQVGICNYANHSLTTASVEAGNVGIGMIRKRARGLCDTEYFKLKIRQLSVPDNQSMFYAKSA